MKTFDLSVWIKAAMDTRGKPANDNSIDAWAIEERKKTLFAKADMAAVRRMQWGIIE